MYQRLTERVPLFRANAPMAVRASFVVLVLLWFWELNESLHILSPTSAMHLDAKQQMGLVFMVLVWGGWQLLNLVLVIGIAYRGNWARVTEFIINVFGMVLILADLLLKQRFNLGPFYFLNALATVLLFVPSAAAWFGESHETRASLASVEKSEN